MVNSSFFLPLRLPDQRLHGALGKAGWEGNPYDGISLKRSTPPGHGRLPAQTLLAGTFRHIQTVPAMSWYLVGATQAHLSCVGAGGLADKVR